MSCSPTEREAARSRRRTEGRQAYVVDAWPLDGAVSCRVGLVRDRSRSLLYSLPRPARRRARLRQGYVEAAAAEGPRLSSLLLVTPSPEVSLQSVFAVCADRVASKVVAVNTRELGNWVRICVDDAFSSGWRREGPPRPPRRRLSRDECSWRRGRRGPRRADFARWGGRGWGDPATGPGPRQHRSGSHHPVNHPALFIV